MQPTNVKTRILAPDVIRGFALIGVLLVNLTMMNGTIGASVPAYNTLQGMDALSSFFIHYFAQAKFYTIFAFLFGFGFYLFSDKPADLRPDYYFKRRMYALLLFGACHLIFVWSGDILHTYAVCGFVMLSKSKKETFNPLKTGALLIGISIILTSVLTAIMAFSAEVVPNAKGIIAYSQFGYLDMVKYRAQNELLLIIFNLPFVMIRILGLFYIGFWVGKERIFNNVDKHMVNIKKLCFNSGGLFVLTVVTEHLLIGSTNHATVFIKSFANEMGSILGATFYVTSILSLLATPLGAKCLSPLRYTGRMALTNYLTQTIFFTTLYNGYGGALFGKIPVSYYIPMALGFYLVQLLLSRLWLNRHKFGPMERIWRKLTYGNLQ